MNPSTKRAREWLYQRKDRLDTAAARDHQTEVFPGSSDGQALPSSPVAVQSRAKVPPVNLASNVSVVHTITMVGTTGQTLDDTAPPARFEGRESDPEGPEGFPTSLEAGFPTTQLVADIPGHVLFDVEWLWGILRDDDGYQDPALGRFRTPAYVTVTRTRGGVDQARTYGRGRVGAAGAKHHLGWTCQKGDIFTFAFPHDDPDAQSMEALTVTVTIIKTAVAGEDAEPPSSIVMTTHSDIGAPPEGGSTSYTEPAIYTVNDEFVAQSVVEWQGPIDTPEQAGFWGLGYDDQGRLWTCDHLGESPDYFSSMVELDPVSGETVQRLNAPDYDHYATAICWDSSIGKFRCTDGDGAMWTWDPDTNTYADTASLPATPPTPPGGDVQDGGWAYCLWVIDGQYWTASTPSATVVEKSAIHRFDPSDGSVLQSITLPLEDDDGWAIIFEGSGTDGTLLYFTSPVDNPDGVTGFDTQVFAIDTSAAIQGRWNAPTWATSASGIAFPLEG